MSTISKALQARNNQRASAKGSIQAKRAGKGKEKVPALRTIVGEAGYGTAIVTTMQAEQQSTRKTILVLMDKSKETQVLALKEIKDARTAAREAITGTSDIAEKKRRSSDASFSRIVSIVQAIVDDLNLLRIRNASSLSEMQAHASKGSGKERGASKKQLLASGFAQWDKKIERVCTKATDTEALARLEAHFMHCLTALSKYSQVTSIPVKEILATANKGRKGTKVLKVANG